MSFFDNLRSLNNIITNFTNTGEIIKEVVDFKTINDRAVNQLASTETETVTPTAESTSTQVNLDIAVKNPIPILYGRGITKGVKFDAALADGTDMYIAYIISEKTGALIDGTPSEIILRRVFINDYECDFDTDGVTVTRIRDRQGNSDTSVNGLIQVKFYSAGSNNQVFPDGYTGTSQPAYDYFPFNWFFDTHPMEDLVFAIVRYRYDATKEFTEIPEISFDCQNNMNQPGDVIHDYLTSTRYGPGIPVEDINV